MDVPMLLQGIGGGFSGRDSGNVYPLPKSPSPKAFGPLSLSPFCVRYFNVWQMTEKERF